VRGADRAHGVGRTERAVEEEVIELRGALEPRAQLHGRGLSRRGDQHRADCERDCAPLARLRQAAGCADVMHENSPFIVVSSARSPGSQRLAETLQQLSALERAPPWRLRARDASIVPLLDLDANQGVGSRMRSPL